MHLIAELPWLLQPQNWPTILAVAGGLGFVIFVHELGHFLVAKACGVKCEKFYIGFDIYGLKICKFQWGETEYGIGILPLGGYVKMLGQDDNPARMAEETRRAQGQAPDKQGAQGDTIATAEHAPAMTHGDLPPEPVSDPHAPYDPRSYMAQSVPKRMAIISAGVIMNVIFAFLMASLAYGLGVPEAPCMVGNTIAGSPAWEQNLEPGDKVVRIDDTKNPRFRDLQTGVTLGDVEQGIPFEIQPAGENETIEVNILPETSFGIPFVGITGPAEVQLIEPEHDQPTIKYSPARGADPAFEPGDKIVQINGVEVASYRDIDRAMVEFIDQPIEVTVLRKPNDPAGTSKENQADQADSASGEKVVIRVEPWAMREFGLVMKLGAITSVRRDSPAARAGIQKGDRLVAIDGQPIGDPLTLGWRMAEAAKENQQVALSIKRVGKEENAKPETLTFDVTPEIPQFSDNLARHSAVPVAPLGIAMDVVPEVVDVKPGTPAATADIKPGDVIIAQKIVVPEPKQPPAKKDVDEGEADEEIEPFPSTEFEFGPRFTWPYYVYELLPVAAPDSQFELTVKRGDETHKVKLPLVEMKDDQGRTVYAPNRGLRFRPMLVTDAAQSLGEAFRLGGAETRDALLMVYRFLQKIGEGQISPKMTSGPVGIVQMAGVKVKEGFPSYLIFLTMLSANLAVINFLPIPVLDGGHMVFLTYELIRGKPASERVIIAFTYAGLIFILTLMLFVLGLDLGLIKRL